MNEEEKKAIERFKANANYCITSKETTKTILNLIKKQQKELEKYKKYYETEKVVWSRKDYVNKDKIKELQNKIYIILDKNAIIRAYQLIIDKEFEDLLGE